MKTSSLFTAALLAVLPTAALAEPVMEWRCSNDSLDVEQAKQRVEWARRCSLTTNSNGPTSSAISNKSFVVVPSFMGANDYAERNLDKAFTGNLFAYSVNYYYVFALHDSQTIVSQSQETAGLTTGYWKWAKFGQTLDRPRPLYPTFNTNPNTAVGHMLFPHPTLADCNLYTDKTGSPASRWTGAFYMVGLCESSCYAPDQKLLFSDGEVNIVEAMKAGRDDLMTLSPDATLDNLALRQDTVYSYTSEMRDGEHLLYTINTASGGSLKVTNEHPVVTSEGQLVRAADLTDGQELLKADGTPDRIVSVEKSTHYGKVYNIKPTARDHVSNLLVAQGYLVGSARFQNDDVGYMNRVLLYRAVPESALPR